MIAITLAAGRGSRMSSLTADKPKVLLEFNHSSLLARQNYLFEKHNIKHYVVGGYKHELLNISSDNLFVNELYAETNMVYSLSCARKLFNEYAGKNDIIISYGDIIYSEKNLTQLLQKKSGDIQVCADLNFLDYWKVRMEDPIDDLESFCTNPNNGFISGIGGKVSSTGDIQAQYIGLFKISADYLLIFLEEYDKLLAQDVVHKKIAMTDFLQHLIKFKKCEAVPVYVEGGWLEFDTDKDWDTYDLLAKSGGISKFYND